VIDDLGCGDPRGKLYLNDFLEAGSGESDDTGTVEKGRRLSSKRAPIIYKYLLIFIIVIV
jgi:hypothetical protein